MFDDMLADMEPNKKLNPLVTELSLKERKLNILLIFISQFYFKVSKTIELHVTHYFIIKIPEKRELQQMTSNHLSDIKFKDFMKFYKDYSKEPFSFLVRGTTLSSDNLLRVKKNLLKNDFYQKNQNN